VSRIVGVPVGLLVLATGLFVGLLVGETVGLFVGLLVLATGLFVGALVGEIVGLFVGLLVLATGLFVGLLVGETVGLFVGLLVGLLVMLLYSNLTVAIAGLTDKSMESAVIVSEFPVPPKSKMV
jgi:hypothetical protein